MVDPAFMLGAAVVKTACKIWLKDHAIAADAAVSVAEIIQAKVADVREQRRVRRLFEDLEERVADSVLGCLDIEFGNVAEHDREAAALAAADTLDKARLTNQDLFAANLDAALLFRAVKPLGRRFTDSLSQDATELWERILHESCTTAAHTWSRWPTRCQASKSACSVRSFPGRRTSCATSTNGSTACPCNWVALARRPSNRST